MTETLVLDGGLSTALEQQGVDLGGALWTARLLGEAPERIAAAHRAYFDAGAQVATTASYQASVEGLVAAGYDAAEARRLITRSVTVAQEVRDELADTHPGRPGRRLRRAVRRVPGRRVGVHRPLRRLRGPAARVPRAPPRAARGGRARPARRRDDPGRRRGRGAGRRCSTSSAYPRGSATPCAATPPAPDSRSPRRTPSLAGSRSVVAAGVNCSEQADVLGAVRAAVAATGLPAVAYPNRGGSWNSDTKTWEYAGPLDLDLVDGWITCRRTFRRRLLRDRPGRHRAAGRARATDRLTRASHVDGQPHLDDVAELQALGLPHGVLDRYDVPAVTWATARS